MLKVSDISFAMEALNVLPGDVIMIHGDAIVAAQLEGNKSKKIYNFIKEIISFLGKKVQLFSLHLHIVLLNLKFLMFRNLKVL